MITTVTRYDVHNMFKEIRPNNFTYDGLTLLFDWIDSEELETDEDYLINVVEICMTWSEYKNFKEIKENYTDIETIEDLQEKTTVLCGYVPLEFIGNTKIEDLKDFPIVIRNF